MGQSPLQSDDLSHQSRRYKNRMGRRSQPPAHPNPERMGKSDGGIHGEIRGNRHYKRLRGKGRYKPPLRNGTNTSGRENSAEIEWRAFATIGNHSRHYASVKFG